MSKRTSPPGYKQLPEYVYPVGVRFQVGMLPAIPDDELGDNDLTMGDMSVDRKRIRVVDTQDSGRRWSTLYHEYIHATFGLTGIDEALAEINEGLEEIIVRTVETVTEQFLLAQGRQWLDALDSQRGDTDE